MQTIRITITSEKPANVVFAEKKPKRKKLSELLRFISKKAVAGSGGDEL